MKKVTNLIAEIDELLNHSFENLVSKEDIKGWKVGESRILSGTISTKVLEDTRHGRFITQIPPLGDFDPHWHDIAEVCKVLGGTMGCKIKGRIWKVDEVAVFSKGEKHQPYNPDPKKACFLQVDFYY